MLTDDQRERYARHLALDEVGESGQEKLLSSKVLVIGTGGLGSAVSYYLCAAGVGTLGIVDNDVVDLTNLQRQILHSTPDLGREKVVSAKEKLNRLNPDVNVIAYKMFVDESNIDDLIKDYDFIVEATDNFDAKFLINDACVRGKKPYCHGGILRFRGQLMTYVPGASPCYLCMFREAPPKGTVPTGRQAGIIGAMSGVIGTLQATEAIKYLLGIGDLLTGRLLTYDALTMRFHIVNLPDNRKNCPVCSKYLDE